MQFWQSSFLCEGDQLIDVAKHCESVGFHGFLLPDHLVHPEKQDSKYLYSPDHKPPQFREDTLWPDVWTLIGALAAVTKKLHFCPNIYILPLRHPIEVAKSTGSLGYFTGGRVHLGTGAGWMKEEFDMMGVDFHTRGKRYDECIEVIRKLQTGKYVEHHGQFFNFPRIIMTPAPPTPVPILIGGTSEPALKRAARLGDGYVSPGQTIDDEIATLKKLDKLRREYGTHDKPFYSLVAIRTEGKPVTPADIRRLEDAGASGYTVYPFPFTIGPGTTLAQKCAEMDRVAEELISKV